MTTQTTAGLLARVKAATGSDRELDMGIDALTDHEGEFDPPPYTASVDSALTLVERMLPGTYVNVGPWFYIDGERVMQRATILRPLWAKWTPDNDWFDTTEGPDAPTAPLAILAALLTALEGRNDD